MTAHAPAPPPSRSSRAAEVAPVWRCCPPCELGRPFLPLLALVRRGSIRRHVASRYVDLRRGRGDGRHLSARLDGRAPRRRRRRRSSPAGCARPWRCAPPSAVAAARGAVGAEHSRRPPRVPPCGPRRPLSSYASPPSAPCSSARRPIPPIAYGVVRSAVKPFPRCNSRIAVSSAIGLVFVLRQARCVTIAKTIA